MVFDSFTRTRDQTGDTDVVAWPFVDEEFDYDQFLAHDHPLFTAPEDAPAPRIAIVGAGVAGMVAAYELFRAGFDPVIFEASGRIGGRVWSLPFRDQSTDSPALAELGAMRIPLQNKVFFHYADKFGLPRSEFPDPGVVETMLYYENAPYRWAARAEPPAIFGMLKADWDRFIGSLLEPIRRPWRAGDRDKVRVVWQRYIDHYKELTFREALLAGIPGWDADELDAFGALGVGSGGFAPLFGVCFLDILRLMVNQLETKQQFIASGVSALTDRLFSDSVWRPGSGLPTSLSSYACLRKGTRVTRITFDRAANKPVVHWCEAARESDPGARQPSEPFDAVIVATTTRAMETMMLCDGGADAVLTRPSVRRAIRGVHMVDSSKLFIRTATKFWLDANGKPLPDFPQTILTDGMPHGVYCLDYPDTKHGVVLISYTWGDDSTKIQALEPEHRLALFRENLMPVHEQFAQALQPLGGTSGIIHIDWQREHDYCGAFKLNQPGQDAGLRELYFQFQTQGDDDRGVYLAGDSVSWLGGWIEGALHTGINAACAAARRARGHVPGVSPLTMNPDRFRY